MAYRPGCGRRIGLGLLRYCLNPTLLSPRQSPSRSRRTGHLVDYRGSPLLVLANANRLRTLADRNRTQGAGVGRGVAEVGLVGEIVGNGKGGRGGDGFGVMGGGELGRIGGTGFGTAGAL